MGRRRAAQIDADFWLMGWGRGSRLGHPDADATVRGPMSRLLLMGNSGSGKSTLASRLAKRDGLEHLDLDVLAWEPGTPPRRMALEQSRKEIARFIEGHPAWVIEGCYADLLETCLPRCTRLVFLNPGIEACESNARLRPWEPHKYPTKEAQDANLTMLLGWIRDYEQRTDVFSLTAHRALYDEFPGAKSELTSLQQITAF